MKRHPLVEAARKLCAQVSELDFSSPVSVVYNPLKYAWAAHEAYLRRYGDRRKRAIFLGMNPGPFGMVQTGVPFGEVAAVRDWLRIDETVHKPAKQHPKRPIIGFSCRRSEVSGRRLWGLFGDRFGTADEFFFEHMVVNYCPLAFLELSGRNRTPDKLPTSERDALFEVCDRHLASVVEILEPEWLIGIGGFAANRAEQAFPDGTPRIESILHPSPASPAANRNWAGKVTRQLQKAGVWR